MSRTSSNGLSIIQNTPRSGKGREKSTKGVESDRHNESGGSSSCPKKKLHSHKWLWFPRLAETLWDLLSSPSRLHSSDCSHSSCSPRLHCPRQTLGYTCEFMIHDRYRKVAQLEPSNAAGAGQNTKSLVTHSSRFCRLPHLPFYPLRQHISLSSVTSQILSHRYLSIRCRSPSLFRGSVPSSVLTD